jgi:hypothetical protein
MSIEAEFSVICNICGREVCEWEGYDSKAEVASVLKDFGWESYEVEGSRRDVCVRCQEERKKTPEEVIIKKAEENAMDAILNLYSVLKKAKKLPETLRETIANDNLAAPFSRKVWFMTGKQVKQVMDYLHEV